MAVCLTVLVYLTGHRVDHGGNHTLALAFAMASPVWTAQAASPDSAHKALVQDAGYLLSFDEHSYVQIGNSACFQNAAMSVLRRCVRRSLARAWTVSSAKSLGQKLANS